MGIIRKDKNLRVTNSSPDGCQEKEQHQIPGRSIFRQCSFIQKGVKFVNTVHDELVFECSEAQAEKVKEIVKTEMEKAGSLFLKDIPCIADVRINEAWVKE